MLESADQPPVINRAGAGLPFAWREFIRFCRELKHGEIERLAIQDGMPVLAEITTKKVKFTQDR